MHGRYILLTGGFDKHSRKDTQTALTLDTVQMKWSTQPSLKTARFAHSSCASEEFAFVSPGLSAYGPVEWFEKLSLLNEPHLGGMRSGREWKRFKIKTFKFRAVTLMATVN